MSAESGDTNELLRRVREGEEDAFAELFARYRPRLVKAIALRMDPRLAARLDASDVLQEAYVEAARRLPAYGSTGDMPFHLWLRWIARDIDRWQQPETARLEYQDWFTPWTEYYQADENTLLEYAQCFYFGE